MEENKNENIEIKEEEKLQETDVEVEVIDPKETKVEESPKQEEPKEVEEKQKISKSSIVYTIILLVALVGLGALSLFLNKCNSNKNGSSTSSIDYSKYIEESNQYKQKLLQIASNYIVESGETLTQQPDELYAYSYNENDLSNTSLLYTVANDESVFFFEIKGFNRADGEDYETTILESDPVNLTKTISYVKRDIEKAHTINFEKDKDFMDLYGSKNNSLKSIIAKGNNPGEYIVSYSFYTNGEISLCSVNNYVFNISDNPFSHKNGQSTLFKRSVETLVYFLFK